MRKHAKQSETPERAEDDAVEEQELEEQEGELVPEREVMSPIPIGDPNFPVKVLPPR